MTTKQPIFPISKRPKKMPCYFWAVRFDGEACLENWEHRSWIGDRDTYWSPDAPNPPRTTPTGEPIVSTAIPPNDTWKDFAQIVRWMLAAVAVGAVLALIHNIIN